MEAREKSLNFITKEKKIVIPFFQRPYVWTQENWEDLFNDLLYGFFALNCIEDH